MKTFILSILVALLGYSNTTAQDETTYGFNKGDFTISGVFNYSLQNSEDNSVNLFTYESKSHNFSIIPEVGYFLSNHFMTGIKLGYVNFKTEGTSNNENSLSSNGNGYTTSLFGRYYFSPQKRISLFLELDAGYSKTKSESSRISSDIDLSSSSSTIENYNITVSPGVNIFMTKNLSLTSRIGKIGYSKNKQRFIASDGDTGINERDNFDARVSLSNFYFGVLYRI